MFTPIHKTISVSDFQRKSKQIFTEVAELDSPTVVMNRNKPISVVMSPEIYGKMIESYENLYDAMQAKLDMKNFKKEDYVSWKKTEKELIKEGIFKKSKK